MAFDITSGKQLTSMAQIRLILWRLDKTTLEIFSFLKSRLGASAFVPNNTFGYGIDMPTILSRFHCLLIYERRCQDM